MPGTTDDKNPIESDTKKPRRVVTLRSGEFGEKMKKGVIQVE